MECGNLGVVAQAEGERRAETVNFDAEARSGGERRGVFEVSDPVKRIAGCSPGDSSRACRYRTTGDLRKRRDQCIKSPNYHLAESMSRGEASAALKSIEN
jgi:hypothetical protein